MGDERGGWPGEGGLSGLGLRWYVIIDFTGKVLTDREYLLELFNMVAGFSSNKYIFATLTSHDSLGLTPDTVDLE